MDGWMVDWMDGLVAIRQNRFHCNCGVEMCEKLKVSDRFPPNIPMLTYVAEICFQPCTKKMFGLQLIITENGVNF